MPPDNCALNLGRVIGPAEQRTSGGKARWRNRSLMLVAGSRGSPVGKEEIALPKENRCKTSYDDDRPLRRLLAALPSTMRRGMVWLLRTRWSWVRVSVGILLVVGGLLGFLPILGFWMIPLGILLLAEEIPFLRRPTMRALGAVQSGWDRWRKRQG